MWIAAGYLEPRGRDHRSSDHPGLDRWEMVIPKMNRPAAWSSRKLIPETKLISEAPVESLPAEVPSRPQEKVSTAQTEIAGTAERSGKREISTGDFAAPDFAFADRKPAGSTRKFVTVGASSLAALLVAGFLALSPTKSTGKDPATTPVVAGPALSMGAPVWTPLAESPRRISIVRGSLNLTDFRMDFQSPVSAKATGWVFRARDSKNYYAMRLEFVKFAAGSSSAVMKRFAVIGGLDQRVTPIPVTIPLQPGGMYKIRTEGLGNTFTTWIADRKFDEWTDARLSDGGVGVYNDHGDPAAVVSDLAVFPLLRK